MTEREAILEYLREEQEKFEDVACKEAQKNGPTLKLERLDSKSSILSTVFRYIERGDHLIGRDVE